MKISIIMSVYKPTKEGLLRTVKSVLSQSFIDYEFIIIKDDEKFSTLELIDSLGQIDFRIKIIDNIKNIGLVKSLNKGLKIAKGQYIARIDVDDWWEKDKLKLQYNLISKDNDVAVVGTKVNLVDTDLKNLINLTAPISDMEIKKSLLNGKNPFTHSSVLFKKFNDVYYNENALHTEDFELWCRYSFLGKMQNLEQRLTNYVVDLNSITGSKRYLMYVNATKVYIKYKKNIKENNRSCIYTGLIEKPNTQMSFVDKLFSKYYALGINELMKNNNLKYYIYLVFSLLINPKIFYFILRRKF